MKLSHSLAIAVATGTFAAAPSSAELLPLSCDDGASVLLGYLDSSPEFEERSELGECGDAPIGDWNRVGFVLETDAARVSAAGVVRSEDGFTLEVRNELALEIEDGELALAAAAVAGEGRFRSPDEDVDAEVIVEIERTGELEEQELSLSVLGPGVDLFEDLDDEPNGEVRFGLELEPDEEYRLVLFAGSEISNTGQGEHALRARIDAIPTPEPAAPLLLVAGALALGARRRFLQSTLWTRRAGDQSSSSSLTTPN